MTLRHAGKILELLTAAELNCYSDLANGEDAEGYHRGLLDFARGIRTRVMEGVYPQSKEVPLAGQTKEARWAAVRSARNERVFLDRILEEALAESAR